MDSNYISYYADISINGVPLDDFRKRSISQIALENPIDGSTSFTITLFDTEMMFIEDDIFLRNAKISASVGLHEIPDSLETFNGYISTIDIDFGEDGAPTIVIMCLDETYLMDRVKKKRTWENTTSSAVVGIIAAEYGLQYKASPYTFKVQDTIPQSKVTDIKFIEDLGKKERDPFKVKVLNGILYYEPIQFNSAPVSIFTYRLFPSDIRSFKPKINRETITIESESSDINAETKQPDVRVATQDNTPRDTTQGDPVKTYEYIYSSELSAWTSKLENTESFETGSVLDSGYKPQQFSKVLGSGFALPPPDRNGDADE